MQVSIRRNLAWMGASQAALVVVQFAGSVVIARLLSPREMGIYAVGAAVVGIVNLIRSFGLNSLIIREAELAPHLTATIFTINAGLNVACALVIFALSWVGSEFLGDPGVGQVLRFLAIMPLVNSLEFLPSILLERNGAFRTIASINVGKTLINSGVTVLMAAFGFSYMSIVLGSLAANLFGTACFNGFGWKFASLRLGLQEWRRVGRFGLQMLTIGAVAGITGRLTDLLIGRLIDLSALGLYSRATGINGLLWDNLHLVVSRVVFVDFAEQHRRRLSLRDSYLKILAILTAFLWPAFTGMAILAGPLVLNIYGEKWLGAAEPLALLSLACVFYVAIAMTWEIYMISGEVSRQVTVELKHNLVGSALFALGCLGGLAWAAASRIGDALYMIFLVKADLERLTGTRPSDYPRIYLHSAGLTLLACGPAALVMLLNGWSAETSLIALLAAVACGVCAWALGLRHLQHPICHEVEAVARRVLGRPQMGA